MKLNNIVSIVALASMLTSGAFADANKTAAKAVTPPVVGGTVIGISVTEILTTGYRASKLLGSNVYNSDGDTIGTIDDFILGSDKNVSFAVISVGGFLGMGARHIAVPATLFERNEKGQLVLPNAKKDELMALPEFKYAK